MADNDGPVPMTAQGHQQLLADLQRLKSVERPRNVRDIEEARAHGDLSENAEFHAAKDRQSFLDVQIREIEDKIARAQVIDVSKLSGDRIVFGATVKLVDDDTEESVSYQIVGEHEAEPREGRISLGSPVARSLIGRRVGDLVEVRTPAGVRNFEVLDVTFIE